VLPQYDHTALRNVFRLGKIAPVRDQAAQHETKDALANDRKILVVLPVFELFFPHGKHGQYCTARPEIFW
jgi:hypothetical protein